MNEYDYETIFDLLLKNSSTCDLLSDLNGKIIRFNEAYSHLIGYSENEIKNNEKTLYPTQESFEKEIASVNQLLSGNKTNIKFSSTRKTKNGDIIGVDVTAFIFKDQNNKPKFILKRIENNAETETEKNQTIYLQAILDEMPMNIYFKDLESRFIMLSKANIKFLGGKTLDDIKGKTDRDFFHEVHANAARKDEEYIISTGKSITKEEKEVHKDNSVTYVLTTKSPLRDKDGNIIGTYGISRDITDIKLAEEKTNQMNDELAEKNRKLQETIEELSRTQNKLIFAEKMAALGNLIGGIAHEINTPLGAIKASSSNIQDVVEKINIDLPWLINHASPEEINWLFKLINEADARDISVFSKEERKKKA